MGDTADFRSSQRMKHRVTAILLLLCSVSWSLIPAGAQKMQRVPVGMWGGDHISMKVDADGAVTDYDCASGFVNGPLTVDRRGRFDLTGTYVREYSGPVRGDKPLTRSGARYSGWTDGKTLRLTVTLLRTNEIVGTFVLERGREGRVSKCKQRT